VFFAGRVLAEEGVLTWSVPVGDWPLNGEHAATDSAAIKNNLRRDIFIPVNLQEV
jgi:hypothetical protein